MIQKGIFALGNFFNKLRYKMSMFMNGRYGTDSFFTFLMWAEVILILVNVFARNSIITLIEFAVIIYSLFRAFSKNTLKRRDENAKYLKIKSKITGFFKLGKDRFHDRKTHVYKKCPSCRAMLRFPKKPGDHKASCPKCGLHFDVHI